MEKKYFISAIAYDSNYMVMDCDHEFAMFSTYEEAKRYYDNVLLDMEIGAVDCCRYENVAYWNLCIELCECFDNYIECVDIPNDCYIQNNYNGYVHHKEYLSHRLDVLSEYHRELEPNEDMNISDLLELFFWAKEYNDNYFPEMKEDTEEARFLQRNWAKYTK